MGRIVLHRVSLRAAFHSTEHDLGVGGTWSMVVTLKTQLLNCPADVGLHGGSGGVSGSMRPHDRNCLCVKQPAYPQWAPHTPLPGSQGTLCTEASRSQQKQAGTLQGHVSSPLEHLGTTSIGDFDGPKISSGAFVTGQFSTKWFFFALGANFTLFGYWLPEEVSQGNGTQTAETFFTLHSLKINFFEITSKRGC